METLDTLESHTLMKNGILCVKGTLYVANDVHLQSTDIIVSNNSLSSKSCPFKLMDVTSIGRHNCPIILCPQNCVLLNLMYVKYN